MDAASKLNRLVLAQKRKEEAIWRRQQRIKEEERAKMEASARIEEEKDDVLRLINHMRDVAHQYRPRRLEELPSLPSATPPAAPSQDYSPLIPSGTSWRDQGPVRRQRGENLWSFNN